MPCLTYFYLYQVFISTARHICTLYYSLNFDVQIRNLMTITKQDSKYPCRALSYNWLESSQVNLETIDSIIPEIPILNFFHLTPIFFSNRQGVVNLMIFEIKVVIKLSKVVFTHILVVRRICSSGKIIIICLNAVFHHTQSKSETPSVIFCKEVIQRQRS